MRFLSAVLVFLSCPAWAGQQPATGTPPPAAPQPAPGSEQALRERAMKFFQAHVEGRFRLADQYVAEDTKDIFFAMEKPRYLRCQFASISYLEDRTRATVVVNCSREMHAPFGKFMMEMPQQTTWKLENGEWFWYVDPNAPIQTPFGAVRRPPAAGGPPAAGAGKPQRPSPNALLTEISRAVRADKTEVRLTAQAPATEVVLTNTLAGSVSLVIEASQAPWLEASLDRRELGRGESARLRLRHKLQDTTPAPATVTVRVAPSGQEIPIRVLGGPAQ